MGRDSSYHQRSPVKGSRRDSPARRDRSQERYKSSSHSYGSPVRGKHSGFDRSPDKKIQRSPSPGRHRKSHKGHYSPGRERNSPLEKPSRREKSLSASPRARRIRSSLVDRDNEYNADKVNPRSNGRSDNRDKHRGKDDERMIERVNTKIDDKRTHTGGEDRGQRKSNGRSVETSSPDTWGVNRDIDYDRNERRSGRDETDRKLSKAKRANSISPSRDHRKVRQKSRSPKQERGVNDLHEMTRTLSTENEDREDDSVARMKAAEEALEAKQKDKPSFELSGKLAAETNRVKGVTLLFTEPSDARKPNLRWQLFVFKGGDLLNEPLYIHRQSCYLFGRERRVADIPTDHPSCSKQHAVLQFRQVNQEEPDGTTTKKVRPYLMDLGSTNKTFINDNPIEPQRYYELFEKDTIKFGNSSREYVLLHENSAA